MDEAIPTPLAPSSRKLARHRWQVEISRRHPTRELSRQVLRAGRFVTRSAAERWARVQAMTHIGYVVPPDNVTECHTITWDTEGELWAQLHGEIGAEMLDATPNLPTPDGGTLRVWVDAMARGSSPRNDRATAIALALGDPTVLAGTAVVTGGGSDRAGVPAGLNDEQLRGLRGVMAKIDQMEKAIAEREQVAGIARRMAAAIEAKDREEVAAALKAFEAVSPLAYAAGLVSVEAIAPDLMPDRS